MSDELDRMLVGVAVECATCGKRKQPIGRSAPLAMANSLCDSECDGHRNRPAPGDLWPGEKREDFGYPAWLVEVANMRNALAEAVKMLGWAQPRLSSAHSLLTGLEGMPGSVVKEGEHCKRVLDCVDEYLERHPVHEPTLGPITPKLG